MTVPYQTYEPVQEPVPIGTEFQCPSSGEAFSFTVRVRWAWVGGVYGRGDIRGDVAPFARQTWDRVVGTARHVLRRFPPDRAADAEDELNRKLEALSRTEQPASGKANWVARAEVDSHDDVRDARRRGWAATRQSGSEQAAALERVAHYRERIRSWRQLLADIGLDDPQETPAPYLAPYLLKLATKPDEAAETVLEMARRREEKDLELMGFLDAAVKGRGSVNLYEYDLAMDTALSRLMQWAGLRSPGGNGDGATP